MADVALRDKPEEFIRVFHEYHNVDDIGNVGFRGFSNSYKKFLLAKTLGLDLVTYRDIQRSPDLFALEVTFWGVFLLSIRATYDPSVDNIVNSLLSKVCIPKLGCK